MTYVVPTLEALKKEGEVGPAQDHAVHALRHARAWRCSSRSASRWRSKARPAWCIAPGFGFRMTAVVSLVAGTMFLMWLGEQITERGLGQRHLDPDLRRHRRGPAQRDRRPSSAAGAHRRDEHHRRAVHHHPGRRLVTFAVVFVERGQRKILVNYAKRQVGNKVYGGQSSHLPLKLNMSGVIPPIFASRRSSCCRPRSVGWFATGDGLRWLKDLSQALLARASRSTCCCTPRHDRVLLLLLHRARVQQPRDGRQPEEERRLHSGHPPGRADRQAHRPHPVAPDAGRCDLHHRGVPAARVPGASSTTCRSTSAAPRC